MDQNINFAVCLKDATDFGVTHVHNVCTGTVQHIAWGSADWALAAGLTAGAAVFVLLFASMAVMMIRDC